MAARMAEPPDADTDDCHASGNRPGRQGEDGVRSRGHPLPRSRHLEAGRSTACCSGVHRIEKSPFVLRLLELVDEELDGVGRAHGRENATKNKDLLQVLARNEKVSFRVPDLRMSMAGKMRLSANLTVQNDFRVTGALEFFEDDFIHTATGIDERRRDNRQRATFLDVSRRTEEALWPLESIGVHTTVRTLPEEGTTVL